MTGPLANPRHERFAQALVEGRSAVDAYVEAGYRRNRGNAAALNANQSILDRVAELQAAAAAATVHTVASITGELERIAQAGAKIDGAKGLSVARAAWMDIAKLNGLVIEKAEVENTLAVVSAEPMSEGEWEERFNGQPPG